MSVFGSHYSWLEPGCFLFTPTSVLRQSPADANRFRHLSGGIDHQMARSADERAANESSFREANETLAERKIVQPSLADRRLPYLCECDDPNCTSIVMLTMVEYETVRSRPTQFVVMPGHHSSPDRVVDEREGFTVIEKTGEEGHLVEEQDPRSKGNSSASR